MSLNQSVVEAQADHVSNLQSAQTKPVIAVDLDEVLGEFVKQLIVFYNDNYLVDEPSRSKSPPLELKHFTSYEFHEVWGGSRDEANQKMFAFFDSPLFINLPVVEGSKECLESLLDRFDFYIVTARSHIIESATLNWLDKHFKGVFKGVLFGNHYTHHLNANQTHRTKAEMCKSINARILIDDSASHARNCAPVCDYVLLFDLNQQYNWNKGKVEHENMPNNVVRMHDWNQIRAFLNQFQPT